MSEYLHEHWQPPDDDERFAETIKVLETLPGGQALLDWFGGRPAFGDGEIVRLDLDRCGASLTVSAQGRRDGSPLTDAIITFVFKKLDTIDVSFEHFNHQNVMNEMYLRFVEPAPVRDDVFGVSAGNIEFEIDSIFGASGTLRATVEKITITPVDDYQKADAPASMTE
jgi:hypothetical protein